MLKILVPGGNGYLGNILVSELLNNDYSVTVIDNLMYRQHHTLLEHCFNSKFRFIKGDVRDSHLIKQEVSKHDVIIDLAALVGAPICEKNPTLAYQVNYEAVKNIVQLKSKDQLFLFPNTNSGYGQGEGAIFTEESELKPISIYGTTKVSAEKSVRQFENTVVFRLATVFGVSSKMRLDLLVNDLTYRAYNDGFISLYEPHFMRNYVHIRDVAKLFRWSIENWNKVKNDVFNFGLSEANLSKLQLCEKIKEHIPEFKITIFDDRCDPDQRNYIVKNDKIEARGFKATISLDVGI